MIELSFQRLEGVFEAPAIGYDSVEGQEPGVELVLGQRHQETPRVQEPTEDDLMGSFVSPAWGRLVTNMANGTT